MAVINLIRDNCLLTQKPEEQTSCCGWLVCMCLRVCAQMVC